MAILAGTDVYRGLNREGDAADNQRLSLTLLANDVRANDQIDAVACAWVTEDAVDMVVAQGREELGLPEAAGASDARCLLDGPALVLRETLPPGCTRRACTATTASSWRSTPWPTPLRSVEGYGHRAVVRLRLLLRGRIADHRHRCRTDVGGSARGGR